MEAARGTGSRAFVAGAGGFLGTEVVRAFAEAGWTVRGLVRSRIGKGRVESAGGEAVLGDILDLEALTAACRDSELLVHVASAIPEGLNRAEKVRVEGCQNLITAARKNNARRLILGSGYWVYADNPSTITEASPTEPKGEALVNWNAERTALDPIIHGPLEVLVVRPGMIYGAGSWLTPIAEAVETRQYRYIDKGANPWSFVSLRDAGKGFVKVAEAGVSGEVYNLVDGHPASWREFSDFVADTLSCPRPGSMPMAEAASAFGSDLAYHLSARRACTSKKIEGLGWKPSSDSYRHGVAQVLIDLRSVRAGGSA